MSTHQVMRTLRLRAVDETGESGISLLYVAPAIGLLILLAVFAGRIGSAQTSLESAAGIAAREASMADTASEAQANARKSVAMTLDQSDFTCQAQTLAVNTAALNNAPGAPGQVDAALSCTVPLSDLTVPGMPGSWSLSATAASPVDTYRERG